MVAFAIDVGILLPFSVAVALYVGGASDSSLVAFSLPVTLVQVLVTALNRVVLTIIFGGSAGKLLLGLRVVDATTGGRPRAARIVLRELAYMGGLLHASFPSGLFVTTAPLLVALVDQALFFSPSNRTLHDRWSRTRVRLVQRRIVGEASA